MTDDVVERLIRMADLVTEFEEGTYWVREQETGLESLCRAVTREFQEGRPITDAVRLLRDPRTASLACSILYDLEEKAHPLLHEIGNLLGSADWSTRGAAVSLLLGLATDADGEIMALAMQRIEDSSSAVRWYCADMLCRMSAAKVSSMAAALDRPNRPLALRSIAPLLRKASVVPSEIESRMAGADASTKLLLMAVAIRAEIDSEDIEALAAKAADKEVSRLASHHLALREIRRSGAS